MAKFELKKHEFAIKEGAAFLPDTSKKPSITINKKGEISITFNYVIDDIKNIQLDLGPIKFLNSGVFNDTQGNNFKNAANVSSLVLSSTPSDDILLTSDSGDIDVSTEGEKGREGLPFMFQSN